MDMHPGGDGSRPKLNFDSHVEIKWPNIKFVLAESEGGDLDKFNLKWVGDRHGDFEGVESLSQLLLSCDFLRQPNVLRFGSTTRIRYASA
jgi:hypothetical protein